MTPDEALCVIADTFDECAMVDFPDVDDIDKNLEGIKYLVRVMSTKEFREAVSVAVAVTMSGTARMPEAYVPHILHALHGCLIHIAALNKEMEECTQG